MPWELQRHPETQASGGGGNGAVTLYDSLGNEIAISSRPLACRLFDGNGQPVGTSTNRLAVEVQAPAPPPGTTPVIEPPQPLIDLVGQTSDFQTYIIPAGKTLTVQRLLMSGERTSSESKVVLYHAPNGVIDGTETIIAMGHLAGQAVAPQELGLDYAGDGVAAIILERTRIDTGRREIFGRWTGFLS